MNLLLPMKRCGDFQGCAIGIGYTLEEMDTAIRYVVPNSQSAAVEWNSVTNKSFSNILKKFNVTVTKSDCESGMAQGDASLAGAAYGIYKGDQLVDTYYTDEAGQFTTGYYVCGDYWTIREISPSEEYLLDSTVYPVGAEAVNYTVELNAAPAVLLPSRCRRAISPSSSTRITVIRRSKLPKRAQCSPSI